MRILILEDNLERIEKFKILFKNQQVTFCNNINDAVAECLVYNFDVLWLDHDLNGKIWENSFKEETGYQFVKWLVDNQEQKKALIYIHSMNPIGANLMLNYLRDNGYDGIWIPFHLLKLEA
jgi:CheY-like chemotaxis protein